MNSKMNADEKRFMKKVRQRPCSCCGADPYHTTTDHMYGATFTNKKVDCGKWALLPLCGSCHYIKSNHGRKTFNEHAGKTQTELFIEQTELYNDEFPDGVYNAIIDWNR